MSKQLTEDELFKLRNKVENLAGELSTLTVLMQYLQFDIEDAANIIQGENEFDPPGLPNRITTTTAHILSNLHDLTKKEYDLMDEII